MTSPSRVHAHYLLCLSAAGGTDPLKKCRTEQIPCRQPVRYSLHLPCHTRRACRLYTRTARPSQEIARTQISASRAACLTRLCLLCCRQHPWFTLHLPRYLAVMQADTIANTAMLDEDIVHEVVKLGFKRSDVVQSIQKRSQNKVRT